MSKHIFLNVKMITSYSKFKNLSREKKKEEMNNLFKQTQIALDIKKSYNRIKINKLIQLIINHPYKDLIYDHFNIESIKNEYIMIDCIDTVFEKIQEINSEYIRYQIQADIKNIDIEYDNQSDKETKIRFNFEEFLKDDDLKFNLQATAIYDSKNMFFNEYDMSKYANSLIKKGFPELIRYNVNFFKELASNNKRLDKRKSYRLVRYKKEDYLRGITSINYHEYGVDFAFVTTMLILHKNMKVNQGINYLIKDCSLSESKLDLVIAEKSSKNAGGFGKISTAIKVSTNDLGNGSLNFSNVINIGTDINNGIFLYPKHKTLNQDKLIISHNTGPDNVLKAINDLAKTLKTSDEFLKELESVKTINSPDELRMKIRAKIESPRSVFKGIKKLSDIFQRRIDNEIDSFKQLLIMCNKADTLEIDYDLKDKLRYIISDIILYGQS